MKLIYCPMCDDVVRLRLAVKRCKCKGSSGHYHDDGLTATITGFAIPLGFAYLSFHHAVANQPNTGQGLTFTAFVIPKDCKAVKRDCACCGKSHPPSNGCRYPELSRSLLARLLKKAGPS